MQCVSAPKAQNAIQPGEQGSNILNANEVFGILKALEPGQDVRVALADKVEPAVADQIVAKVEELTQKG